jgi:hypothetical protein
MFATADLIDAHEAAVQSCDLQFRVFWRANPFPWADPDGPLP